MKEIKREETLLKGVLQEFPRRTYPGRIYVMYDWDWEEDKWVVNGEFHKKRVAKERDEKIDQLLKK